MFKKKRVLERLENTHFSTVFGAQMENLWEAYLFLEFQLPYKPVLLN